MLGNVLRAAWRAQVIASVCSLFFGAAALADAAFDQGVRLFNQRNYKAAMPFFESALRSSPWDSNAYYYAALTAHYAGDFARAKQLYRQVYERFPGTQAASLSEAALNRIDPNFKNRNQGGSSAGAQTAAASPSQSASDGGDLASLPAEARIYFTPVNNSLMIDGELNNRRVQMIFDTGAEACVFGKNHLRQLGITPPDGPPTGFARGVGSTGVLKTWTVRTNLKVGNIERRNFPVLVQEDLPTDPLLGQTFFKDFEYTIDNGGRSIHFKKKTSGVASAGHQSSANDRYAVPFTREGNEMVVLAEVNGRPVRCYFDTGASGTLSFGKDHLRQAGLTVPDDAQEAISTGIGGQTRSQVFHVQRIRLGPIEKYDLPVSVSEASNMNYPLLGQGFYGDWQYTIDNDRKVIKFVRR